MSWFYLSVAGLLEVAWAYAMKQSHGFTEPRSTALTLVGMLASFALLATAMRELPLGTAYAVWTGIGAAGTAILGIVLFAEPLSLARIFCIGLIVAGIIGLKLAAS